jgi:GAF domain-containing protein
LTQPSARNAKEADAAALASAREQQAAVADILRAISRSPKDLRAVLDVIATSARRFCSAEDAMVGLVEGDRLISGAHDGPVDFVYGTAPLDRQLPAARCIVDGRVIHVRDMQTEPGEDFKFAREFAVKYGVHTVLATPMLHDGKAIGSITLRRNEIRPFTDEQIELLRTFADQAVIAVQNVRLFNETKESLERQTAISEILRAIAKSPSDELPVLQTIADSATRFCGAGDATVLILRGDELVPVAHHGPIPSDERRPLKFDRTALSARAMMERRTLGVTDILDPEGDEYPQARQRYETTKQRALLAAPLFREGAAIGAILLRKLEPVAFTASEIALVEAFADQAVIAIENVRLFNETKEALERQTATSEVLKVISGSAFELQPVFESLIDKAVRLGGAHNGSIIRRAGDKFFYAAHAGEFEQSDPLGEGLRHPEAKNAAQIRWTIRPGPEQVTGRVLVEGRTVQIPDILADREYVLQAGQSRKVRAILGVPILRGRDLVGIVILRRVQPGLFDQKRIELVESFAAQAAIAIENVRLFNETKESLERQTAIGEILRAMSSSPTDVQPVLDAIAKTATSLPRTTVPLICPSSDTCWIVARSRVGRSSSCGRSTRRT